MPLDEFEQLPNLVRLGHSTNVLQVHQFRNAHPFHDVMTPARPLMLKPEGLGKLHGFDETQATRIV
jgi:hypothetical protein